MKLVGKLIDIFWATFLVIVSDMINPRRVKHIVIPGSNYPVAILRGSMRNVF